MFKKVFSMLLLVSMLCLALASCGDTDLEKSREYLKNNTLKDKNPRETLTFCLVTDTALDNASLLAMQASFNKVLEGSDKTHLQFVNWTTAEYEAKLAEKLADVKAKREAEGVGTAGGSTAANEYPLVLDTQFDIILITSHEMLSSLIEAEQVVDLTEMMDKKYYGLFKNEGIPSSFLLNAKLDDKTYGIPNCRVLGEYTYLVVNKSYAEYFGYFYEGEFTDWESTEALRASIAASTDDAFKYTFTDDAYDVNAPVRLVKGDYAYRNELQALSGYYWYIDEVPTVNRSELFTSMFAVSSYSVDAARAMEVIYEINTRKSLRTILEYGIQNDTYELENGIVKVESESAYTYQANPLYTGNIFALYPTEETKGLVDGWKIHNSQLVFVDDLIPAEPAPEEGGANAE